MQILKLQNQATDYILLYYQVRVNRNKKNGYTLFDLRYYRSAIVGGCTWWSQQEG